MYVKNVNIRSKIKDGIQSADKISIHWFLSEDLLISNRKETSKNKYTIAVLEKTLYGNNNLKK